MAKVMIVGCGDLGSRVAQQMRLKGHDVLGVRRSQQQNTDISYVQADVTLPETLRALASYRPNILIYCVAASAQTDESYHLHYVLGLKHVLETQENNMDLQHAFFTSSTRVYGQDVPQLLNETTPAMPKDFGGVRLLEAEQLLTQLSCDSTVVRLAGIYGKARRYLLNLALDPERWPQQDRWTNRIHLADAAGFVSFLCEKALVGEQLDQCYIGVDDEPVQLSKVLSWLATAHDVKHAVLESAAVTGKRLSNQRMRNAGYQLRYANYREGYGEILSHV